MTSTANWCFGALAPTLNGDLVAEQMLAAHRYRNKLVELERKRRDVADATARRLHPGYAALAEAVKRAEDRVTAAYDAIKRARAKARKRSPVTAEQEQEIADAKAERKEAWEAAAPARAEAYEMIKQMAEKLWPQARELAFADPKKQSKLLAAEEAQAKAAIRAQKTEADTRWRRLVRPYWLSLCEAADIDAGQASYQREQKIARATCGCFWGTYLVVEEAASGFGSGPPPKYERESPYGTIAVQLPGGLTVEDAMSGRNRTLQLRVANEEELALTGKSRRVKARGSLVRIRIGSTGRDPVWAEIPVLFHRLPPRDGVIKWAYIHRTPHGPDVRWSLRLTIESKTPDVQMPESSVCAVHPGYRLMRDGTIRLACLAATRFPPELFEHPLLRQYLVREGDIVEARLPAAALWRVEKAASIDAYRDRRANRRAARLVRWLDSHRDILPQWLIEESETIALWHATDRFHRLRDKWKERRFDGDELVMALFDRWASRDRHLHRYAYGLASKAKAWRTHFYRTLAKWLAEHYTNVIAPKINWQALRKAAAVDEEVKQVARQRQIANLASPAELVKFITEKCGVRLIVVPSKDITRQCQTCGQIDDWDRRHRCHTCTGCGDQFDQDHNAARNELARALMSGNSPGSLAGIETKGDASQNQVVEEVDGKAKKRTARKTRSNRRIEQRLQLQR